MRFTGERKVNVMTEKEFVEKIGLLAAKDSKKSGILASITAAQAILESGYGSTELAVNANNLFGMKAYLSGNTWSGSTWDGQSIYHKLTKEQNSKGDVFEVYADFRKYGSWEESVADHSAYLLGATKGIAKQEKRYAGLNLERDYQKAAQIIKDGGYATDVQYVAKLCNIIQKWNLTKFDSEEEMEEVKMKIYISPSDQTGNLYSAGNTNEHAQCQRIAEAAAAALKRNGYEVKIGAEGSTYQQRVEESNNWGADIHMPIHTNAGGGDGTVVFAYPASVENKYVKAVYNAVAQVSPGADDGIRAVNNLYEINNSKCTCVYLECEFHDDYELASWIIEHIQDIGEAIAKGYCNADGKKFIALSTDSGSVSTDVSTEKMYRVQIGAYSVKANAEKQLARAKAAGFDAIIKYE